MKYEAIIFDCDGTLLWTIDDLRDATNYALDLLGCPLKTTEEILKLVGNGIGNLVMGALPNNQKDLHPKAMEYFAAYYEVHFADKTCPYDGIVETVQKIKEMGIKVAVVSNKQEKYLLPLFDKLFKDVFPVVMGESKYLAKKPAPDMVDEALRRLNVDKNKAVYVGDSEVDVRTAFNSDMDLIAVAWGFRSKENLIQNGAKIIIDTPSELLDII